MISSDEMSGTVLFKWLANRTVLQITVDAGLAALEGSGHILRFDEDCIDLGVSNLWEISIVLADASASAAVPANKPDSVVVGIVSGSVKCSLVGKQVVIRPGPV